MNQVGFGQALAISLLFISAFGGPLWFGVWLYNHLSRVSGLKDNRDGRADNSASDGHELRSYKT